MATWPVTDVVDGDTVHARFHGTDESVRVIGIDTPETVHPTEPVECGGPAASAAAHRLLEGQDVQLVFDRSQGRRDVYGRMLAYVDIPGVGDFGKLMIHQGHAAEYTFDTAYVRRPQYLRAQEFAQANGLGVWAKCGGVDTPLRRSTPAPAPAPAPAPRAPGGNCDPNYDPCVPPYPPDIDCSDVNGPIRVLGDDPHGFDADGDGTAATRRTPRPDLAHGGSLGRDAKSSSFIRAPVSRMNDIALPTPKPEPNTDTRRRGSEGGACDSGIGAYPREPMQG